MCPDEMFLIGLARLDQKWGGKDFLMGGQMVERLGTKERIQVRQAGGSSTLNLSSFFFSETRNSNFEIQ